MSENLIAQELGIENAEALTVSIEKKQLKERAAERLSALQTAAEELGFDSEGLSEEELTIAVESVLEKKLAKELAEQLHQRKEILSEYLGVENISNLSVEEVKAILEEKSTAAC
jgi:predicted metal-dependent hydrolase